MKRNKLMKQDLKLYKYKYLFLVIIIFVGFVTGIIFSNILSYNDKKEVGEVIVNYFSSLKSGVAINYFGNFLTTISTNFLYLLLIFLFGISIIGLVLNPFLLYIKGFMIGFSIGALITVYSFIGIPLGVFFIFPHAILNLVAYILMSFYGMNLSLKLFKSLFLKKAFNYGEFMRRYVKVFLIGAGILIVSSLYETFLLDFVMKLFTFLIK